MIGDGAMIELVSATLQDNTTSVSVREQGIIGKHICAVGAEASTIRVVDLAIRDDQTVIVAVSHGGVDLNAEGTTLDKGVIDSVARTFMGNIDAPPQVVSMVIK